MKLDVTSRTIGKKSKINQIRRDGDIPAIIYSKGEAGKEIVVNGQAFRKILQTVERGTLSSKVFSLNLGGKALQAILKDIQYHPVTYEVLHIDFEELHKDLPITLNIPVKCTGVANCAGIKLGGILRQVTRSVKVRCLPKDIPSHFEVDVSELVMGQAKRLSEMKIPATVQPIVDLKEVAVVIARR